MTKKAIALLPLLCLLTLAMGGSGAAPSVAAPTTPSLTAPDVCEQPEPQWGACRWYCGSKSYQTRSQCQSNCSTECEQIC